MHNNFRKGNKNLFLLKKKRPENSSLFSNMFDFLVNQIVALRAEAWERGACATTDDWFAGCVTALGYNLKYVNHRSRIAQNIFLHNAFEIKLLDYSVNYSAYCGVASIAVMKPHFCDFAVAEVNVWSPERYAA